MFKKFKNEEKGEVVAYLLILFAILSLLWVYAPKIKEIAFGSTEDSVTKVDEVTKPMEDKPTNPSTGGENPPPVIEKPQEQLTFCGLEKSDSFYTTKPAGRGVQSDPYQLKTLQDFQWLSNLHTKATTSNFYADCHMVLANDIDASATKTWDSGKGFLPVIGEDVYFSLHLDGQNHTISNLYINRPGDTLGVGLFRTMGDVKNIKMKNADITGGTNVGILAGDGSPLGGGEYQNIEVQGKVKGDSNVGGVLGAAVSTRTVKNITADTTISGCSSASVGGFTGVMGGGQSDGKGGTLERVNIHVNLDSCNKAGGLVGQIREKLTVKNAEVFVSHNSTANVYNFGALTTEYATKFPIKPDFRLIVEDSSFSLNANVNTFSFPVFYGIFVSASDLPMSFKNVYFYNNLSVKDPVTQSKKDKIPLILTTSAAYPLNVQAQNFYYNNDNPFLAISPFGKGVTTTNLKNQSTFYGFDFGSTWNIDPNQNNGFPFLR